LKQLGFAAIGLFSVVWGNRRRWQCCRW